MKASRLVRRWARTRDLRLLPWGVPAILGCLAWLFFLLCLAAWKPWRTETSYSSIAAKALATKDFQTARVASQRLLALGVEPRRKHLFDLALAYGGLDQDQEAVALLANIAPVDRPGYLPAHLFVAQTLLSKTNLTLQEITTAERHLKHVVALNPQSLDANELLGRVYVRLGKWELAEKFLSEVVSVRPEVSLLLAAVLKAQGDSVGSRSWAERAAKLHRTRVEEAKADRPASRLAWADAMAMLGDYSAALGILEAGWRQYEDRSYLSPMGEVCALWVDTLARVKPGELAGRITLIQRGLEYAPENEPLLRQLIRLTHLEGPEAAAARDTLNRMLTSGRATAILHFTLGVDSWQRGRPDEARKHLTLAYEIAPKMPQVANNMAMILTVGDKPDLPRALAVITSVLEKFPDNPGFRETRGQILVRLGRWQEAVADLEYALPSQVSKRGTHKALAEAYRGLNLRDLAAEHERRANEPAGERARL
jgi:tetratricopeptide (TPR) repeat protein